MKKRATIILSCSGANHIAKRIAKKANVQYGKVLTERFPDSELKVLLKGNVKNKRVYFVQSFYSGEKSDVNDKLVEVLFAAQTAKKLGAKKVFLIAPYLAYLREDKRFEKGESVSARIIAKMFGIFERVYVVEPHLHRFKSFDEFFSNAVRIRLFEEIVKHVNKNVKGETVVVGPDVESEQWAIPVAEQFGFEHFILSKMRFGSRKVRVRGKKIKAENVVIIDDIISTGRTLLEAAKLVKAKRVYFIGMHGLFAEGAGKKLRKKGKVVVSNSIPSKFSKLDCASILARVVK